MRILGGALLLTLALASNAWAFCVAGFGTSCPIGPSEVERFLRPRIDGRLYGSYALKLEVEKYRVTFTRDHEHEAGQLIGAIRSRVLPFMQGSGDCAAILSVVPEVFRGKPGQPGVAKWAANVVKNCERSRAFMRRNLARLTMLEEKNSGTWVARIVLVLTEGGRKRVEAVKLDSGPLAWIEKVGGVQARVATGRLRFQGLLRSSEGPVIGGQNVTEVEFAFEVIPNEWAHIEQGLVSDTLKPTVRVGRAVFQRWSDGWRLVDGPHLR